MESEEICPICLDTFQAPCITACQHLFCKLCLIALFKSKPDLECPYCRQELKPTEIKLIADGSSIFKTPSSILGSVYVQFGLLGLASYHFDHNDDCYISYTSDICLQWPALANGDRPPHRKPFINPIINEEERTFTGDIVWAPTNWMGDALWRYQMKFSEDYMTIEDGFVKCYDAVENGFLNKRLEYGTQLIYRRSLPESDWDVT